MKIYIFIFFIFSWIATSEASTSFSEGCFEKHIQDSINLNFKMKNHFSEQTNKESDKIYNYLILGEKAAIYGARHFDRKAQRFHEQGIDLFCQEFLPMNSHPQKVALDSLPIPHKFNWKKYSRLLRRELRLGDIEAIKDYTLEALTELKKEPHYHCFTRHLLESIYRFAYFVQLRENQATKLNLESPKELMVKAMEYQRLGLLGANKIDEMSFSIQMKGIPLLCEQLPPLLDGII